MTYIHYRHYYEKASATTNVVVVSGSKSLGGLGNV